MKNLLFLIVSLILVGCTKTPTEKAEALIKAEMPNTLILPESYDPISTQVDSAFYPLDSPELYAKSYQLFQIAQEMESAKRTAETEKSSMMIWANSWDSFSKNEYQQHKAKFEEASKRETELLEKGKSLAEEIKSNLSETPKFMGYKAIHKYRAKNNAGQVLMGENCLILNEDLTKINFNFSTDDPAYLAGKQIIAEFMDN